MLLLLIAAVIALGLFILKTKPPPTRPPLPSPNGYDDFMKAAQMLAANTSDFHQLGEERLRKLVTQNKASIQLVRTGLSRKCRVPIVYSLAYLKRHLPQVTSVKRLAQALAAEGRLAEWEHRNGEAAEAYLDIIRLGQEASRGGMLIDGLVGIACEAIGLDGLQTVLTNLECTIQHG